MARAPSEEPRGLVYRPDLLTAGEEAALLDVLASLRFDPIVIRGRAARRTARHYGLDYDYGSRTPRPGEPVPDWLLPLRARAAGLADVEPDELVEILVQRYPPDAAIGWHRDAPAFGTVTGISLGSAARLRFQRARASAGASGSSSRSRARATCWRARRARPGSTRSRRPRSCATRSRSGRSGGVNRPLTGRNNGFHGPWL